MNDSTVVCFQFIVLIPFIAVAITAWRRIQINVVRYGMLWIGGSVVVLFLNGLAVQTIEQAILEGPRRSMCRNNLKQIGLAISNYDDTFQQLPFAGAVVPEVGTVCSWRIALLPYIDEDPLYSKYHFDEPWDSPLNKKLQERCPFWYHCPTHVSERRLTDYIMVRGAATVGGDGITSISAKDLIDGTSNTIQIVEASGTEIIWAEPKDVEATDERVGINLPSHQPGRSDGVISSHHTGGAYVLLSDGSVRFISEKADKNVLKRLLTIRGGERLPDER